MNQLILVIVAALILALGCAPVVYVESAPDDEPCLSCSDAIKGASLSDANACSGSLETWQAYKLQTCAEPSLCKVYCLASLCDGKAPSHDCKACAVVGTIFHPYQQDQNYLTCKADK